MVKLNGKVVVVTGVSKGLGKEITEVLIKDNYTVLGISRNSVKVFENSNTFQHLKFDLINYEKLEEFLKINIGNRYIITGLVNNAAIAYDDLVTNLSLPKLEDMFKVNVYSSYVLTKFCLRNMIFHKTKGSIVHISSISTQTGYTGLSMYASTKGALEAFSKNISREWGRKSIRSNCIVTGFMETDMTDSLDQNQKNRIYKRTSLDQPTDKICVAKTVEFLLSDKSNSITGQLINVDSGTI